MVNSVPVARVVKVSFFNRNSFYYTRIVWRKYSFYKIVKAITRACPTWSVLTPWVTSLLVQRSMESAGHPTTAGL